MNNPLAIQQQIRQNASELQTFLGELQEWEQEMDKTDTALKQGKMKLTKPRKNIPVRGTATHTTTTTTTTANDDVKTPAAEPTVAPTTVAGPGAATDADEEAFLAAKTLGNSCYKAGKYDEAVQHYSTCISVSSRNMVGYTNRAMALLKLDRFSEAEADCTRAILYDRTNEKAFYRRAMARKGHDDIDGAVQDLKHLVKIAPSNRIAKAELAKLREKQLEQQAIKEKQQRAAAQRRQTAKTSIKRKKLIIEEVDDDDDDDEDDEDNDGGSGGNEQTTPNVTSSKPLIEEVDENSTSSPASVVGADEKHSSVSADSKSTIDAVTTPALANTINVKLVAPTSAYEFETLFRSIKRSADHVLEYFAMIPFGKFPDMMKTAMDADFLRDVTTAVVSTQTHKNHPAKAASILQALTKIPRFGMTAMCLDDAAEEAVCTILRHLKSESTAVDQQLVSTLAEEWDADL
jgi:RNA polymerase II-associated protein 3